MKNSPRLLAAVLRIVFLIGIVVILYFGKSFLLTLTLGALLAMLLDPVDRKLRSRGWPRWAGIATSVLIVLLIFGGLFFAVGQQTNQFADNWPQIKQRIEKQVNKLTEEFPVISDMVPGSSTVSAPQNSQPTSDRSTPDSTVGSATDSLRLGAPPAGGGSGSGMMDSLPISGSSVASFFSTLMGWIADFLLMLVYVVLFLSQKERLREFVLRRAPDDHREETRQAINESVSIAQSYLVGRLILIGFLAVLYGIGFSISGVKYAIFLAVLAAVLSVIPYLGNIIGGTLALAISFAGGGESSALVGILVTMSVAQLIENYLLEPLVVGDKVDINPLTTIACIVAFTVMWGPVGAIIAIPIFAILRILCNYIPGLQDYAYLLGQE